MSVQGEGAPQGRGQKRVVHPADLGGRGLHLSLLAFPVTTGRL